MLLKEAVSSLSLPSTCSSSHSECQNCNVNCHPSRDNIMDMGLYSGTLSNDLH